MDKEHVLNAIDVLIFEELESNSPARYQNIQKLCKHAHDINQMAETRVGGVITDGDAIIGGYDEDANGNYYVRENIAVHPRNGDQADLMRELIAAMATIAKPAPTVNPMHKLQDLISLRESLSNAGFHTTPIDARIEQALEEGIDA